MPLLTIDPSMLLLVLPQGGVGLFPCGMQLAARKSSLQGPMRSGVQMSLGTPWPTSARCVGLELPYPSYCYVERLG